MGPMRVVILIVALVAAVVAALLVRNMTKSAQVKAQPSIVASAPQVIEKPTARVLVAKRDLTVGTRLGETDIGWQAWPLEGVQPTYITDDPAAAAKLAQPAGKAAAKLAQAATDAVSGPAGPMVAMLGSVVRETIYAGEPIVQRKLVHAGAAGVIPNAIDIVTRGIKSGLPIQECLKVIARESPAPINTEFQRLVENMSVGLSIDQGLEKMYERMPTSEVRFLAIVMAIQSKTGGNLAEALGNLTTVLRARKLMREKVKAMSGEAVASAFIIGSLPPGIMALVSVSSPGYMAPLFQDPRGHMFLLGGALWMATGIFVMRRMINFKL